MRRWRRLATARAGAAGACAGAAGVQQRHGKSSAEARVVATMLRKEKERT
ncbi:hypothetical protein QJS04_geneDACA003650 [Acorus gramineus]|uniref:Uncharacterized protein n=1 Tax=Acorus gramineus TaxID=55184 RepID=A0AAV9BQU6_ACOGR|nr:hypothetical protein QJS04_geneDACA003650 [Acorus gramineus]